MAMDYQGHGDTPDHPCAGTYVFADAVSAAVDGCNLRGPISQTTATISHIVQRSHQHVHAGCHVFGHSLGGCYAIINEARDPGTFSSIMSWEPVVYSDQQCRGCVQSDDKQLTVVGSHSSYAPQDEHARRRH